MLFTRNAFQFRKYFKEQRSANYIDLNFIGALYKPVNKPPIEGFASLTLGNREDVGKYLSTVALNVAADDQAIYELIQNADDSKASFFSVTYDEKYLICINNGNYFSDNDMSAIINVAGNFKDGEDIGTFGIGFKILHRLVGKDDGRDAIIEDYAGPIIFSWNKPSQFEKFVNEEPINVSGLGKGKENYDYEKDKENAWLIKILYTCFPSNYKEPIRINDYETRETRFDQIELLEMRTFLKKVLQDTNIKGEGRRKLQNGSIFFLKLGAGKKKFLDEGIEKIKSGLSYSFKFLNSLKKIYINGQEIQEQKIDFYAKSYSIGSVEFNRINPKNKNRDIKFTFAFYKDYYKAEDLRNSLVPNLYTFFSMEEEKNGLNFLLHCNAFDMSNNRRHLQSNSQINEELLPIIASEITQYLEKQKESNRELFLTLYANLLLSNEQKNKPHINNYFFKFLKDYLCLNIPTQNSISAKAENVKIKGTYLSIEPADFDCPEIDWFAWKSEKYDRALIDEAQNSNKLYLEKWGIIELLKYAVSNGKIEIINDWVKQVNERYFEDINFRDSTYLLFIQEIDKNILERDVFAISQIKLFKFSDGNYYSLNDLFSEPTNILIYDKVAKIKKELRHLGFNVSNLNILKYPNLLKLILPKFNEEILFQAITEKCKKNKLRAEQKHNLFFTLAEFDRIGVEKLKDLELFKDAQGNIRPLRTLVKGDLILPNWLFRFKVHITEYIPELDKFLVKENDIYQAIILKNWDSIILGDLNINRFYKQVSQYYKQNQENQTLERVSSIFTNDGFKRSDEVFFNQNLNTDKFYDLQSSILKITGKQIPNTIIFDYLTDDTSPFKISKNESLADYIAESYLLTYSEIIAVLRFAKRANEKLFSAAYTEKQGGSFFLVKSSPSIFQYFSNRKEINELLLNHCNFKLLPGEFNANEFIELGIWHGRSLYLKLVQTLEFSVNLLPIVRENDKELQLAYLERIKDLRLLEGKIYDRNSFEHQFLKLAIDCYGDEFNQKFGHKIMINEELRVKEIAVKDDINFGDLTLSLASVLPEYKGVSDIITKIINQFTDFAKIELSRNVFPIDNKKKEEVYAELTIKFPTLVNIEQFAFLLFYSKQLEKNLFTNSSLLNLSKSDIMEFVYKINFVDVCKFIDLEIKDKIYPSELALKNERLPDWILSWINSNEKDKKLSFISQLGVHIQSSTISEIRSYFVKKTKLDQGKIGRDNSLSSGVILSNTLQFIKEKELKIEDDDQFVVLKQIIDVSNYYLSKEKQLIIYDVFDREQIINNSKESELKTDIFKIHLFNGELPRIVTINKTESFIYYRYSYGDYFLHGNDIYINALTDYKKTLEKVVADESNNLTFEDLWKVFNSEESNQDNPFLEISEEEETFIRKIIKGDFELNEKLDANVTAKIKTLLAIRNQYIGYDISDEGQFLKIGLDEIVVRSAQNGLLYLDIYHWGKLNESNVKLSIYTKNEIEIFNTQEDLINFTKPQNKFGIVRMSNDYSIKDYHALDNVSDKAKWHYVFIVNENTKVVKNYKELMNLDDYNF